MMLSEVLLGRVVSCSCVLAGAAVTSRARACTRLSGLDMHGLQSGYEVGGPIKFCDEAIMGPKAHGTSSAPAQANLRWNVDSKAADRICNFNREGAEYRGYWKVGARFLQEEVQRGEPLVFYDSVTGRPLFAAPRDRSIEDFLAESDTHGWPSFRDAEVVWKNVRVCEASGETVSTTGTHLGHNLPDGKGNRYCINLSSVAGRPAGATAEPKTAMPPAVSWELRTLRDSSLDCGLARQAGHWICLQTCTTKSRGSAAKASGTMLGSARRKSWRLGSSAGSAHPMQKPCAARGA